MAETSFAAQVDAWVRETKERGTAIFHESAQRVVSEMQTPVKAGGNMPVDTGYLRASLTASTSGMPPIRPDAAPADGVTYTYDGAAIALVIAGSELGDTIFVGYGAAYAQRLHYGFVGEDAAGRTINQAGRQWVTLAAQRWPQIVAEVTSEAKARSS